MMIQNQQTEFTFHPGKPFLEALSLDPEEEIESK